MLEIICTSYEDVLNAIRGGADRIELVDNLPLGGTTPSFELIEKIIALDVPVNVMLRCRGGNFFYDEEEVLMMKKQAQDMKKMGVNCIVFGALDANGQVATDVLDSVVGDNNLYMTFHRAIDEGSMIIKNVTLLNGIHYVKNILTSGGAGKAIEHIDTINQIINISNKKIIVGSGITLENIYQIKNKLNGSYDIHVGKGARTDNVVSEKMVRKLRRFEK